MPSLNVSNDLFESIHPINIPICMAASRKIWMYDKGNDKIAGARISHSPAYNLLFDMTTIISCLFLPHPIFCFVFVFTDFTPSCVFSALQWHPLNLSSPALHKIGLVLSVTVKHWFMQGQSILFATQNTLTAHILTCFYLATKALGYFHFSRVLLFYRDPSTFQWTHSSHYSLRYYKILYIYNQWQYPRCTAVCLLRHSLVYLNSFGSEILQTTKT